MQMIFTGFPENTRKYFAYIFKSNLLKLSEKERERFLLPARLNTNCQVLRNICASYYAHKINNNLFNFLYRSVTKRHRGNCILEKNITLKVIQSLFFCVQRNVTGIMQSLNIYINYNDHFDFLDALFHNDKENKWHPRLRT